MSYILKKASNVPTGFLGYLHSFRGAAIIKIVLGHAVAAAFIAAYGTFDESHPLIMVSEIFYHDSTLYFAIISGLLFTRVLEPKGYFKFFSSKVRNILLPYLFFTLVFTFITIRFHDAKSFQEGLGFYFSKVYRNLIYGKANFALWYIPVLIVLYLATPVLHRLQKTNTWTKIIFFGVMFIPLVVSRIQMVGDYIFKFETVVYFMGAYALGMYLGTDLETKFQTIKKHKAAIVVTAIVSTGLLFYLYAEKIDMLGRVSLRESVFYIQKILFAIIFIMLLKRLGNSQPKWLKPIARDSFSIYFMHGSILYASYHWFMFIIGIKTIEPFNIVFGSVFLIVFSISVSMAVVFVFRKVFGKYSRMIVGA